MNATLQPGDQTMLLVLELCVFSSLYDKSVLCVPTVSDQRNSIIQYLKTINPVRNEVLKAKQLYCSDMTLIIIVGTTSSEPEGSAQTDRWACLFVPRRGVWSLPVKHQTIMLF